MATQYTGWGCTHSTEIIAENNTSITIRVHCYWQNSGWRYNISNVYAYVYCGNQSATVLNNGAVNSSNIANTAALWIGSADFSFSKTHAAQSISCYATIDSNSSYAGNYTRSSSASTVSVAARPTHTITYYANGGTGAPAAQTKWYSEAITLSTTKPSRTGYTFQNWNTNTSNTGTTYAPGATYNSNANLTLYAIWKANTYTVSYNANGGSNPPANQTKTHDVNLTLSSTKPTRTDYEFLGWSTSSTATTATYAAGGTFTTNANTTLFAVWKLAYKKPRITNFKAYRCDSAGASSETGTYIKVSFGWATDKTVTSVKAQHKLQSSSTWTDTPITASSTSGTPSVAIGGGGINTEKSYHVRVYVSDSGGETYSVTLSIGTVKFPIDVKSGGTGVAIGKVAENSNEFDVGWNARFRGMTTLTSSAVNFGATRDANVNGSWVRMFTIFFSAIWKSYSTTFMLADTQATGKNALLNIYLRKGASGDAVVITNFDFIRFNCGSMANKVCAVVRDTNYVDIYVLMGSNESPSITILSETRLAQSSEFGSITFDCTTVVSSLPSGTSKMATYIPDQSVALYDNSSGTTGTITLSQSAGNFRFLEIFFSQYADGSRFKSSRIPNPNGKIARIGSWGSTYLYYSDVTFSETSATRPSYTKTTISNGASETKNEITIYKILGYK